MGEDAGRDRLEELQRRPRQHQHVEDEARRGGALEAADDQRPGVEEGLFAEHDQQHRRGEAAAVGEGEVLVVLARPRPVAAAPSRLLALGSAGEGERDDQQRERRARR